MPEILRDAGVYFDPEQPESLAAALAQLLPDADKRAALARAAYDRAGSYSWKRCADETFRFLAELAGQRSGFHRVHTL